MKELIIFLTCFLCSEYVSLWNNDFLAMASTFLSVALIHSFPLSSELFELGGVSERRVVGNLPPDKLLCY